MATIEYRKSTQQDRDGILGVLSANMTQIPDMLRVKIFDWQFGDANPHSDGRSPFWIAVVDGEIGGVNGMMPVKVRYKGESLLGVWSCDTLVRETHRGMGLGKGLLTRVAQEADVVLGYGISDMSDPILAKLGWELNPNSRGLFYYVAEAGARGLIKNARSSLFRLAHWRLENKGLEIKARENDPFGEEIDALWLSCQADYPNTVMRDAAYLNWRYRDHPYLRYIAYEARRAGELKAVLIVRHHAIESVVVDYCGPSGYEDQKAGLLDAAVNDLAQRGTRRIRCESTDPVMLRLLEQSGFRHTKAHFRFRAWSNRHGDVGPANDWLVMAGDSDNDFSVVARLFENQT